MVNTTLLDKITRPSPDQLRKKEYERTSAKAERFVAFMDRKKENKGHSDSCPSSAGYYVGIQDKS